MLQTNPKKKHIEQLQKNLIRSHAANVGEFFSEQVVRAAMLTRINCLAKGYSGIRLHTLETLVEMLNKSVLPAVPKKGSVGASGDLSPLSHIALVLIGEGFAFYNGKIVDGKTALKKAKIKPVELSFKEGLCLINGTSMMTGLAALTVNDAYSLVEHAQLSAAMSIEALRASKSPFESFGHEAKPFKGQLKVAKKFRSYIRKRLLPICSRCCSLYNFS